MNESDLKKIKTHLVSSVQREISHRSPSPDKYRQKVAQLIQKLFVNLNISMPDEDRDLLFKHVFNEILGYGPLQPLLDANDISEIMVVGPNLVFIERNGVLAETDVKFDDDAHIIRIIERMIHPIGRRIDDDHPAVDARLPDGSRVHAVIPPVSVDGPCITIRKFLPNMITVDELIQLDSITDEMAEFLQACVSARLNIVVSGGTSSGKTTMLNVLSGFIPDTERIITIEDAVELSLHQKHTVRLETKNANVDGHGGIDTRELVRNALRMRPDRIIVGEARAGEALDMLQAMNTGHDGSITTLHANSPRDAIARMETMCMMAGLDMPLLAIRKQIAAAVNLIVHQARLEDGTRKTTKITEVAGMESDVVTLSDIFKFERQGLGPNGEILGDLKPTGIRPLFTPRLELVGFKLAGRIFGAGGSVQWRNTPKSSSKRR